MRRAVNVHQLVASVALALLVSWLVSLENGTGNALVVGLTIFVALLVLAVITNRRRRF